MQYGCIGEKLRHSFSKEIHGALAGYDYVLREVARDALDDFMTAHDFAAINVTIPYKERVIPYLHSIDEHAKSIGAVNTIVNRGGKLYGYNTDFFGMQALLAHAHIEVSGKKVAILGTGGTAKTAKAVATALGAREILTVSRSGKSGAISYDALYAQHADTEVILNTTPAGMYPDIFSQAVDLSGFPHLCGVMDAVYNPLRTPLVLQARARGVAAEGGLYMLVAQAVRASEIFTDTVRREGALEAIFRKMLREKQNIVLIGMPASGKSTVGKMLANRLRRKLIDTDAIITQRAGIPIAEIFATRGEAAFRALEREVVREVSAQTGVVIATGGGVPLDKTNVTALSENGRLYFIDRPLARLMPTASRPLASTKEAIAKRYQERYPLYIAAADVQIDANCDAKTVANRIWEDVQP